MSAKLVPLRGVDPRFDARLDIGNRAIDEGKRWWYAQHPNFQGAPGHLVSAEMFEHAAALLEEQARCLRRIAARARRKASQEPRP